MHLPAVALRVDLLAAAIGPAGATNNAATVTSKATQFLDRLNRYHHVRNLSPGVLIENPIRSWALVPSGGPVVIVAGFNHVDLFSIATPSRFIADYGSEQPAPEESSTDLRSDFRLDRLRGCTRSSTALPQRLDAGRAACG